MPFICVLWHCLISLRGLKLALDVDSSKGWAKCHDSKCGSVARPRCSGEWRSRMSDEVDSLAYVLA